MRKSWGLNTVGVLKSDLFSGKTGEFSAILWELLSEYSGELFSNEFETFGTERFKVDDDDEEDCEDDDDDDEDERGEYGFGGAILTKYILELCGTDSSLCERVCCRELLIGFELIFT